jgi:hypothetical protein
MDGITAVIWHPSMPTDTFHIAGRAGEAIRSMRKTYRGYSIPVTSDSGRGAL